MSAFIVGPDHINALITAARHLSIAHNQAAFRWRIARGLVDHFLDHTNEDEVGAMLLAENYRSVNYRYNETDNAPSYAHTPWFPGIAVPGPTTFFGLRHLVVLFKSIHCYEYQSCETPDWPRSSACGFCRALKALAERSLPGYENAAGWRLLRADAATSPANSNMEAG